MKKYDSILIVAGDVHGQQNALYHSIESWERKHLVKADLVICVGDFQPIRDSNDLNGIECPEKYKVMGDFADYYNYRKQIPIDTWFIGGNHEPYNYLESYKDGGWLIGSEKDETGSSLFNDPSVVFGKSCYYFGRYGIRNDRFDIRVAGLTGIYNPKLYERKFLRSFPNYNWAGMGKNQKKVFGMYTASDVSKLEAIGTKIDILVTHDWPYDICIDDRITSNNPDRFGNSQKPRLGVGSPAVTELLEYFKPRIAVCGHMHQYYSGEISWETGESTTVLCLSQVATDWGANFAAIGVSSNGLEIIDIWSGEIANKNI